ncbi:TonB-dependent receptor domain-containing protein [Pedobacter duraquae]|uniref:Outer membrane beta-barrel protein n=1 Tax=Pedobacter duraquae TaxID=425511 RepID=A0A4R6IP39_9SPHI|nr:TonB-dependent receptor [Pedobacter duraquae]TDO23901.1 outer membrane beta-barrel protein [Pedobacter duraquae]
METKTTFTLLLSMLCLFIQAAAQEQKTTIKKDSVQQLQQVTIQGKAPLITKKAGVLTLNVAASASAAGNPLLEILRQIPGVSVINDKISIRGKEGLIIMIDNRRTYMSGDELLSYLKNTPAESINQIEMISNPSSKYDAEGNVGILNIKTKRNVVNGLTGSASQTLGYGRYLKSTTGGQAAYTNNALMIYGNSYLSYSKTDDTYITRSNNTTDGSLFTRDYSTNSNKNNYAFQLGLDYKLSARSSVGAVWDGSIRPDYALKGISDLQKTGINPQFLITDKQSATDQRNNAANIHYNSSNPENTDQWNADLNYVNYDYSLGSAQNTDYLQIQDILTPQPERLRNNSVRKITVFSAKADYTHKWLEKFSFESGIKWSRVQTESELVYEQLQNDKWINDTGRTNQYNFDEQIYAGYGNFNGTFGTYTVQAGLRGEYTANTGLSKTLQDTKKNSYLKLFPSLVIANTFSKKHTVDLTYAYRIDRPTYSYLNPFIFINNPYSYFRGNPYLKPQFTHNLEANYDYKKLIFVSLSYSRTKDLISEIVERGQEADVVGGTRTNLNTMNSFNFTVNAPLHPAKGWDVNLYLGGFRNSINNDNSFSSAQNTFTASANSTITLPAAITLDINGYYQTAMSYGVIRLDPMYGLNGGFRRSFLKNKLSLRLNVSDILHTQRTQYNSEFDGIVRSGLNTSESTVVRATVSYKFGNTNSRKGRKTGVEDEQRRI